MGLHRVVSAAAAVFVAIALALALPVSQLRTMSVKKECCCPDPTKCHCPDHKAPSKSHTGMRACHSSEQVTISPEAPELTPPDVTLVEPVRVAIAIELPAISAPHDPPAPAAPYGPS